MKSYIASYQDRKGECWDIILSANTWGDALKDARKMKKEYGDLYSLRLIKIASYEAEK